MDVVYATDLSEPSEAGIKSQTCIDCLKQVGVDTFHLITVINVSARSAVAPFDLESPKEERLDEERRWLEAEGFDVETHVVRGTPYRRINDLAEKVDADLIIIGSKGKHGRVRDSLVGSTTINMARTAVRPLLIERIVERSGEPRVAEEKLFSRVLHPTDFSENAQRAYNEFQTIKPSLEEADILHVLTREQRRLDRSEEEIQTQLAEFREPLEEAGVETTTSVRRGEAVEEIMAEEREFDPSLLLVGSRGMSRIRRLLLGSVTEDLIAKSESNILLVPPRRTEGTRT